MKFNSLLLSFSLLSALATSTFARPTTTTSGLRTRTKTRSNVRVEHAARAVVQSRQYNPKKPRSHNNDCPPVPLPSNKCTQTCAKNAVPQTDGSCACRFPFYPVTSGPDKGKCQVPCILGFTPNADGNGCVCLGFKFATFPSLKCVQSCPPGYFGDPVSKICKACPAGVATCDSGTVATSCGKEPGINIQLYLDPILKICVSVCSDGTFLDKLLGQCSQCPAGATTCSDGDTATSCGKDSATGLQLYLNNLGVCVDDCGSGFVGDLLGKCVSCPPGATSCSDKDTATACRLDDSTGLRLFLNNAGVCVKTCGTGLFGDLLGKCSPCPGGATSCSDGNTATACGTDKNTGVQLFLNNLGVCVNACGTGFFGDLLGKCKACPSGATTCSDENTATSCGTDDATGVQLFLNDLGICVKTCGTGLFGDLLGKCSKCPAGATSCSDANTATACGTDDTTGVQLFLNKLGVCVSTCGAGLFGNLLGQCQTCPFGATSCSDANTATACGTDDATGLQLFLNDLGVCVGSCGSGLFGDLLGNKCSTCPDGATSCSDADTATVCGEKNGVKLYLSPANLCVSACGTGFFGDLLGKCSKCPAGATTCSDANTATQCGPNLFLDALGVCVSTCGTGFFGDLLGKCSSCPAGATTCSDANTATACGNESGTGVKLFLNSLGVCVKACGDGFFGDLLLGQCGACAAGVKTCTGPNVGDALSCLTSFIFGGKCMTSCPAGTSADGGQCKALPTYARIPNKKITNTNPGSTVNTYAGSFCASYCSPFGGGVLAAGTCKCKLSSAATANLTNDGSATTYLPGRCSQYSQAGSNCFDVYFEPNTVALLSCRRVSDGGLC